jgi:hypothetical protein
MADKGGAFNKQGRNMQRQRGKFTKAGEQSHENRDNDKEKWPVDEIPEKD